MKAIASSYLTGDFFIFDCKHFKRRIAGEKKIATLFLKWKKDKNNICRINCID